jgi:hypothetical protein
LEAPHAETSQNVQALLPTEYCSVGSLKIPF